MSDPTRAEAVPIPAQKSSGRHKPRHRSASPAHPVAPPTQVTSTSTVERIYATPGWVQPTAPHAAILPRQTAPDHDDATAPDGSFTRPPGLITQGRWSTARSARSAVVLLFVASLAAAIATGAGVMTTRSTSDLTVALTCLLAASGLYAVLVALRPTVIELDEVWLTVRDQGHVDMFDLTNPFQEIAVSGAPGTSRWRLVLGCPDRRTVAITGRMVDSRRLDVVVRYAQRYAERDRVARIDRFAR